MSKSRVEQKAALMKRAESIIDELLDWEAEVERSNLEQIEGKVLELRERLSRDMARVTIKGQDQVRPAGNSSFCSRRVPSMYLIRLPLDDLIH